MRYTPISELYRQVRERKLTPQEIEDREKIAKKLPMDDFKKRYGKDAMAVKMATATNIVKKKSAKSEVKEDGHTDVASAIRQCKTVTEDAMQILQKLKSMSPEDSLPSWWTNKLAVASNSMNKLRDYFLVPSVSEETELDEASMTYRIRKAQKSEIDKMIKSAGMMKLQIQSSIGDIIKMQKGGDVEITVSGRAKNLKNFDDLVRGKSSYGDPSLLKKEETELNEAEVNVYGFISTGERKKFLDNLKSMRLQFKSKVMNLPMPAPASGVLNFNANQSTIEAIIKFAKRMKLKIIKEEVGEELDKDDEDTVKTIIGKLKKASKAHAGQAKQLSKDLQDEKELDEMKYTHAVVDFKRSLKKFSDAKVIGFATNEKDAKFMAKNNLKGKKGTVVKLKKPMSQKKGDMMINRPLEEEVELSETIVDFDYSRNPKAIFNAFLQMSRRLNLTLFNAPTGMKDLQSKGTGRIGGTKQNMLKFMKYLNGKGIEPKVEIINEQRSSTGYTLYHRSFSDAMQHAYAFARTKMGMTVDPKEIDNKVATGPRKPSPGKSNSYSLKTNKGMLQIQVYNTGGGAKPFELNMYSS